MNKTLFSIIIPLFVIALSFLSSCNKNNEDQILNKVIENGCLNTGVSATIDDWQIFAPNIFTPNEDGINDKFTLTFLVADSINFEGAVSVIITRDDIGTVHSDQINLDEPDAGWAWRTYDTWDGRNSDSQIIVGIYQYEIAGSANGTDFKFTGELTLIEDRTFLEHCQKCDPLNPGDPAISCAD